MNTLTRRTFLRAAGGAVLALPWLESLHAAPVVMTPARRLAFFYVPIGVVRRSFFPGEQARGLLSAADLKRARKGFQESDAKYPRGLRPLTLTPTLRPLEKLAGRVTLVTGLSRVHQDVSDAHEQCASCFLTSLAPYEDKSRKMPQGRTFDHIAAERIGTETPFRTLEFSCNSHRDNKESIHFDNISWYGPDHVAPSIRDPRTAYRRMFGGKGSDGNRQITDLVLEDARSLSRRLGNADRAKFGEYFESIRTIEVQMDRLAAMRSELDKMNLPEPSVAYLPRGEYIRLMGDLMVVALQSRLTNVATMMIGPERWDTPYLFEELSDKPMSHHQMSHNQTEYVEQLEKVDEFHMRQFAYLVEKMAGIREANGSSLLDNTLFTYGSGLGDGATHQYDRLPIIVAGNGGGKVRSGQHLHCGEGMPLANLWLTQARILGLERERFADSTGVLTELLG